MTFQTIDLTEMPAPTEREKGQSRYEDVVRQVLALPKGKCLIVTAESHGNQTAKMFINCVRSVVRLRSAKKLRSRIVGSRIFLWPEDPVGVSQ